MARQERFTRVADAGTAAQAAIDLGLAQIKADNVIDGLDEEFLRDVLRIGFEAGVRSTHAGSVLEYGVEARTFVDGPFDRVYGPMSRDRAVYDLHLFNQLRQPVAQLIERARPGRWATSADQPEWADPRGLERPQH